MGKRIIQQARGKGSHTYRVRKKAFRYKLGYPMNQGTAHIIKLLHSPAHSAPIMKLSIQGETFYNAAFNGAIQGEDITIGNNDTQDGNITQLSNIPLTTKIYNIERNPGDGGKLIRTAGSNAIIYKKFDNGKISVLMPNKKHVLLDGNCRATIGTIAGQGRKLKPFVKAGRKFYKMKAKGKLWPRVSAVATNAVDHPFGSGRGKHVKSKTAKKNASPGQKVGHIRPRKTGKKR